MANFTPDLKPYTGQGKFRYWVQMVLPTIYDDSLSYMELLNKVVYALNLAIEDVTAVEDNVAALLTAFEELQQFTNDYFNNLDVQEEINNKLDQMAEDGTLTNILAPLLSPTIEHFNGEIAALNSAVASLNARVDSFETLPEGSTIGDAELIDIRTAFDGLTYETAGDSVRTQAKNIFNRFKSYTQIANSINVAPIDVGAWEVGTITEGAPAPSSVRLRTKNYLPVEQLKEYIIIRTIPQSIAIVLYDINYNYIETTAYTIANSYIMPVNTAYIKLLMKNADSSTITLKVVNDNIIYLIKADTNNKDAVERLQQELMLIAENTSKNGMPIIINYRSFPNFGSILNTGAENNSPTRKRTNLIDVSNLGNYIKVTPGNNDTNYVVAGYNQDGTFKEILKSATQGEQLINLKGAAKIKIVAYFGSSTTQRVETIYDKFNFIISSPSEVSTKLKLCTYNVGKYNYGTAGTIDEAKVIEEARKFFTMESCDILALQEATESLGAETADNGIYTYLYPYIFNGNGTIPTDIKSRYKLINPEYGTLTEGSRPYTKAYITIDNKTICLITVHLGLTEQVRYENTTELLNMIKDEEYVIIAGDFNAGNSDGDAQTEFNRWKASGYKTANGDYFGLLKTHYRTTRNTLDNVITTNNITIANAYVPNVYEEMFSDHIPLIVDLII